MAHPYIPPKCSMDNQHDGTEHLAINNGAAEMAIALATKKLLQLKSGKAVASTGWSVITSLG
ncbi:hypothetical protein B0I35DRAFT_444678 [Stachybotrys elegans]|uniref:Uncharacterized protein n=1 Tax=Stachybotrys elegans TaxID=80388 RepID=A0A8K0SAU7_9HYPO|nr:hypothetical protein B0I35DRAFT_444678 [Stachybotrys elegans]